MEQSEPRMDTIVRPSQRMSVWKIVAYIVVALLLAGIGYTGWKSYKQSTRYSIVYLQTGEIYVGKLTFFPKIKLKDPYILRVTKDEKDPKKSSFQLSPLKETVWNTKSLTLNKAHVVFYGLLDNDSKAGKALLNAGTQGAAQQPAPAETPSQAPAAPVPAPAAPEKNSTETPEVKQ